MPFDLTAIVTQIIGILIGLLLPALESLGIPTEFLEAFLPKA
ncbi:MAG: hypothetical protein AMXMBFR84_18380 [Candidatus Hydrogenedentota bacterium]